MLTTKFNHVNKIKASFKKPLVLLYHRIANDPINSQLLAVSPQNFEGHLKELAENYNVVPLVKFIEQIRRNQLKPNTVAITFDDGYADNLINALPILEKYNLPATVFITTGMIGSDREFWWDAMERIFMANYPLPNTLSITDSQGLLKWNITTPQNRIKAWDELCRLLRVQPVTKIDQIIDPLLVWAGLPLVGRNSHLVMNQKQLLELASCPLIEIGSHTVTHSKLSELTLKGQSFQILMSKRQLELTIQKPVWLFSYPYGSKDDFTEETKQIVAKAGYRAGMANVQANIEPPVDIYAIPRKVVRNCTGQEFTLWLKEEGEAILEAQAISERAQRLIDCQSNISIKRNM